MVKIEEFTIQTVVSHLFTLNYSKLGTYINLFVLNRQQQ